MPQPGVEDEEEAGRRGVVGGACRWQEDREGASGVRGEVSWGGAGVSPFNGGRG